MKEKSNKNIKIREFFKPTWWKIVITLLIPFYLTYTIQYGMNNIMDSNVWWGFDNGYSPLIILIPTMIYVYFFKTFATPLGSYMQIFQFLSYIIIPLIVNYLIACLIVHIYKKFKSEND